MKLLFLVLATVVVSAKNLRAAESEIIHVQRSLPMSEDEPIYKDYYISGGSQVGLKVNTVVKVFRTVHVGKGGKTAEGVKIEIPVGLLKVIYSRPQLAVARLYEAQDIEKNPGLETPAILVGDKVEVTGPVNESKNKSLPQEDAGT